MTFREIGAELGMSAPGAHKALKRGLQDRANEISEAADELRALEAERLDAAAAALWPKVMAGEERAQEVWLRKAPLRAGCSHSSRRGRAWPGYSPGT